jgi:hypothetical protein
MISEKENHAQVKNRRGSKTYMKSNHDVSDYLVDLPWKCALPEFPTSPHCYWLWLEYLESASERECHRQGPTSARYRTDPYSSPTSRCLLFLSFHDDDDDEPKGLRPCSILSWLLNRWSILHGIYPGEGITTKVRKGLAITKYVIQNPDPFNKQNCSWSI